MASRLNTQFARFAAIGAASTAIHAVLYLFARQWSSPLVANLIALTLATVLNTEANLRLTFAGNGVPAIRVHVQSFAIFCVYYAITSGAVLLLHAVAVRPSRFLELAVLLAAAAAGTVVRFAALRLWVFRESSPSLNP